MVEHLSHIDRFVSIQLEQLGKSKVWNCDPILVQHPRQYPSVIPGEGWWSCHRWCGTCKEEKLCLIFCWSSLRSWNIKWGYMMTTKNEDQWHGWCLVSDWSSLMFCLDCITLVGRRPGNNLGGDGCGDGDGDDCGDGNGDIANMDEDCLMKHSTFFCKLVKVWSLHHRTRDDSRVHLFLRCCHIYHGNINAQIIQKTKRSWWKTSTYAVDCRTFTLLKNPWLGRRTP